MTPSTPDPGIELESEVTNWAGAGSDGLGQCVGGGVYNGGPSFLSSPSLGSASRAVTLWGCEPRISTGFWANGSVDVRIRVVCFGKTGSPTPIEVSIRGVTRVPTDELASEVELDASPGTVFLEAVKDTVIYRRNPTFGNGFGEFLWSGQDHETFGTPPFVTNLWYGLRSLLAFEVIDALPPNAIVTNAGLRLYAWDVLGGGGSVSLYHVAPDANDETGHSGDANPPDNEFFGALSTLSHASWNDRRNPFVPRSAPGGDLETPALDSIAITQSGFHTFSTPALGSAVQGMIDRQAGADEDGFLLAGPFPDIVSVDRAVRMASDQHPSTTRRPRLRVDYAPGGPYAAGIQRSGTVTFIGEGDNFRWIYDTDQDDVLVTPINGVCEIIDEPDNVEFPRIVPYTYSYEGEPGYVGVDCCAWQVDSPQTGTAGTGQVLFYHGLDPTDPNNLPPDTDGDGIPDLCDNCDLVPSGPALGTCVGVSGAGASCRSDLGCGLYETCSLSQEDADLDFAGDACSVPEPGFGLGVTIAAITFAGVRRRHVLAAATPSPGTPSDLPRNHLV